MSSEVTRSPRIRTEAEKERRRRQRRARRRRYPTQFRRRAGKYGVPYQNVNRFEIYLRDNFTCYLCGQKVDLDAPVHDDSYPSLDHIVPLSHGGAHSYDNCATAHQKCNRDKSDQPAPGQQPITAESVTPAISWWQRLWVTLRGR